MDYEGRGTPGRVNGAPLSLRPVGEAGVQNADAPANGPAWPRGDALGQMWAAPPRLSRPAPP